MKGYKALIGKIWSKKHLLQYLSFSRYLRIARMRKAERDGVILWGRIPTTKCLMAVKPGNWLARKWYIDGNYEPENVNFFNKYLKKGMICIDCGANEGYFSLYMAKLIGPTGKVYAFEPTCGTYRKLLNNISANHFTNIVAENAAVGERSATVVLNEGPEGYEVYNTLGKVVHPSTRGVKFAPVAIQMIKIDEYCNMKGIHKVDMVKIDIEGAELLALKGMEQTLRGQKELLLLIEVDNQLTEALGYKVEAIKEWFLERDYTFKEIRSSGKLRDCHFTYGTGKMLVAAKGSHRLCQAL